MTPFEVIETTGINITINEVAATTVVKPEISESKIIERNNDTLIIPSCPKCNSKMIQRTAKKGARQGQTFYGCSQFPKCRGVVNNSEV